LNEFICGGAWISVNTAITAAHCLIPTASAVSFEHEILKIQVIKSDQNLDLALIKLNPSKPHAFFKIASHDPAPTDNIMIVSHSNQLDWSIQKTHVAAIRPLIGHNSNGPYLQIHDPIFPGDSGSPIIFNNSLSGIISFTLKNKNIGFATSQINLSKFIAK
jgi:V8-like Glu-specific endopeptidase